MKKYFLVVVPIVALATVLVWWIWGQGKSCTIHVTIPAGTTGEFVSIEDFIYSNEKISPRKKQLILKAIDVPNRTEFVLQPMEETEDGSRRTWFDNGQPLIIDVEKGAWYTIGIALQNPTDEDIVVGIHVENVKVKMK